MKLGRYQDVKCPVCGKTIHIEIINQQMPLNEYRIWDGTLRVTCKITNAMEHRDCRLMKDSLKSVSYSME